MPPIVSISLNDQASPQLGKLKELIPSRRIMAAIGVGCERVLKDHFLVRESEPNKMGWPKQHIWAGISRATQLQRSGITENSAKISIASPILGAKIEGAYITPKGTSHRTGKPLRYLARPLRQEAYGISPKNQNNLRFEFVPGIGPALVEADATTLKRGKRGGKDVLKQGPSVGGLAMYQLITHADIPPDPRALPATDKFIEAAAKVVDREVAKTKPGNN